MSNNLTHFLGFTVGESNFLRIVYIRAPVCVRAREASQPFFSAKFDQKFIENILFQIFQFDGFLKFV